MARPDRTVTSWEADRIEVRDARGRLLVIRVNAHRVVFRMLRDEYLVVATDTRRLPILAGQPRTAVEAEAIVARVLAGEGEAAWRGVLKPLDRPVPRACAGALAGSLGGLGRLAGVLGAAGGRPILPEAIAMGLSPAALAPLLDRRRTSFAGPIFNNSGDTTMLDLTDEDLARAYAEGLRQRHSLRVHCSLARHRAAARAKCDGAGRSQPSGVRIGTGSAGEGRKAREIEAAAARILAAGRRATR